VTKKSNSLSAETKFSCIKTELKRCMATESLESIWHCAQVVGGTSQAFAQSGAEGEGTWTHMHHYFLPGENENPRWLKIYRKGYKLWVL